MTGGNNGAAAPADNVILTASNETAFFDSRQTTIKAVLLYVRARASPVLCVGGLACGFA